ncbi:MAG: fused MFS/spermidine synthase [Magnetococcales bacterium]|nr:fused MFS/spermidine synthase [Magnetococcales bacterium]
MCPEDRRMLYRRPHGGRVVEVVEDRHFRTLAFDSHLTQSRMSLEDPNLLVLRYTRRMMAGLLFLEVLAENRPFRVLMIGLGGGSMVKFLLHHFPGCHMDVVENDPLLPPLARQFFHVPTDPRLTLFVEDGALFVERMSRTRPERRYDLILLDAFDQVGMARGVYADPVFAQAHERLTAHGVLVINLIRSDGALFHQGTEAIRRRFPQAAWSLTVPGFNNEILFAGPGVIPWEQRRELESRALELEARLGINHPGYLQEMARISEPKSWKRWLGFGSSRR